MAEIFDMRRQVNRVCCGDSVGEMPWAWGLEREEEDKD